jgi:hypothetical protein
MTFQECEMAILRAAVDKAGEVQSKRVVNSSEVQKMISIVEQFLRRKRLVCYGGTAINALLPRHDKFYNKETDLADYDFFSKNPVKDAKELADVFYKAGFEEVEAKSGQHHGTYKVFVNFIGMADITYLNKDIFDTLQKEAHMIGGILYCPPNYLRMSMYLELSRPEGDVSRWEKVLKRISLLNKHHPLKKMDCENTLFQRELSPATQKLVDDKTLYNIVKDTLVGEGVVFFGGFAISTYLKYMPKHVKQKLENIPDFDVFSEEAKTTATILKEQLDAAGINGVKVCRKESVGEVISPHYQVIVNDLDTVAFIYEPMACHNYNKIDIDGAPVQIATIDTMLSLYLAFLYSKRDYYNLNRLLCMAKFLYEVQEKNRLKQKGVLKRFSINCYGRQETIEDMRAEKTVMFKKLKTDRGSKEYEEWFLKYRPDGITNTNVPVKKSPAKKKKSKTSSKTKRKNKSKNKNKNNASRKTTATKKTRSNKKRTRSGKKTRKERVSHYLKGLMDRKKK